MNTLRISIWACLSFASATASTVVLAQYENANADGRLTFTSQILPNSCLLSALNNSTLNKNVFQLPPMTTITLDANAMGPVTSIEINLNSQITAKDCNLGSVQLVFDTAMAAVSPRSGLLRNSAKFRPAENVFLQVGFIDKNGEFIEMDLNQPQLLNQTLNIRNTSNAKVNEDTFGFLTPNNSLKLGVRYVTSRAFAAQLATLPADQTGSQDVTAGNVSIYLPFLLKLN
jgi:hypothetical protein